MAVHEEIIMQNFSNMSLKTQETVQQKLIYFLNFNPLNKWNSVD